MMMAEAAEAARVRAGEAAAAMRCWQREAAQERQAMMVAEVAEARARAAAAAVAVRLPGGRRGARRASRLCFRWRAPESEARKGGGCRLSGRDLGLDHDHRRRERLGLGRRRADAEAREAAATCAAAAAAGLVTELAPAPAEAAAATAAAPAQPVAVLCTSRRAWRTRALARRAAVSARRGALDRRPEARAAPAAHPRRTARAPG